MNNDPDWDPALFAGTRRLYYGRWSYKYESAARAGRPPGRSSSTRRRRPGTAGRWCRTRGPASSSSCRPAASRGSRCAAWTTEDATRKLARGRGLRPRRARRAGAQPRLQAGAARHPHLARARQHDHARRDRQRARGHPAAATRRSKDEVVVFSAHHDHLGIGKPDAQRRHDLQRRRRQRDRRRAGARDRQGVHGAARAAAALDPVRDRELRGVGAARLGVLRRPSHVPAGEDRRRHQLRRGEHLRQDARRGARRQGQVHPRRGRRGGRRAAGARRHRRAVPRPRRLLPLRPVQLREDRRARPLLQGRPRLRRARARLGEEGQRGVAEGPLPPAERRVLGELELRRDDRGHPTRVPRRPAVAQADAMPTWLPGDEFAKLRAPASAGSR